MNVLTPLFIFLLARFSTAFVSSPDTSSSRGLARRGSTREQDVAADVDIAKEAPPTATTGQFSPQDLEHTFAETMWKMRVLQEYPDYVTTRPRELRHMFRQCEESVRVDQSTIPAAGLGLFASRGVPVGSVLTFYPVHALGLNFRDGSTYLHSREGHDHIKFVYVLSLVGNRPIMGIDLDEGFDGMGFGDAIPDDPDRASSPAWQCHRINDRAVISENTPESAMEYYHASLGRQNAAFLPFGPSPITVAMATKDIPAGQDIFTCYGRGYWLGVVERDRELWSERTEDIALTERKIRASAQIIWRRSTRWKNINCTKPLTTSLKSDGFHLQHSNFLDPLTRRG